MNDIIIQVALGVIALWLGSIEYRWRTMSNRIYTMPDKQEVRELIDLKQEVVKAMQIEVKEDISELKQKLDTIEGLLRRQLPK